MPLLCLPYSLVGCSPSVSKAGHTTSPVALPPAEPTAPFDPLSESSAEAPQTTAPRALAPLHVASPSAGPVLNEELHHIRLRAQRGTLGGNSPEGPEAMAYQTPPSLLVPPDTTAVEGPVVLDPAPPALLGVWTPLQGEVFLQQFYEALDDLAASKRTKVRVLAYGASHTQADVYTDYLRRYLQLRFGDGGQGFMHIGRANRFYRTAGAEMGMSDLSPRHAQSIKDMRDGALGLLGTELSGSKVGAYGEVALRASSTNTRFELAYLKAKDGGRFSILVDKKEITGVDSRATEEEMGFVPFETLPGPRVIRAQVQGGGTVHFLGLTAENDQPGVVVDTLGINGSRMANQLKWHEGLWVQAIQRRDPSLVIYAFGTNETMDLHQKIGLYEQEVREVIARLKRATPGASCLLLAPFDFPREEGELWKTRPRLLEILEVQKRVSQEAGCAFWNAYNYMGGPGSMRKWAMAHPPLARSDNIHLTAIGYVRAAIAFTDALMRGYDAEGLAGGVIQRPGPGTLPPSPQPVERLP